MSDTTTPHRPRRRDRRPVIAIAGLAIETSTFTPTRTHAPAFHPDRGDEVVARYPFLGRAATPRTSTAH